MDQVLAGLQHDPWGVPALAIMGKLLFGALACWLALAVHELGHALVARLVGVRIWGISVGKGPLLWRGMVGGCRVRLALLPIAGSVQLLDADAKRIGYSIRPGSWRFRWNPGAWRAPAISMAGALSNLAGAALVGWSAALAGPPLLAYFASCLLVANLTGYFNLLPMFSSDGAHLLAHLSALRQHLEPPTS